MKKFQLIRSGDGSITVFTVFLFLTLLLLTGSVLDSARFFGSTGYVKTSAYGAELAAYGAYNRELFREYGLLGVGGYAGMDQADWEETYQNILVQNLQERPEPKEQTGLWDRYKRYASVYQIRKVRTEMTQVQYLTEQEVFLRQIRQWLKSVAVQDISDALLSHANGGETSVRESMMDSLEKTEQAEEKKEEQEKGEKNTEEQKKPDVGMKTEPAVRKDEMSGASDKKEPSAEETSGQSENGETSEDTQDSQPPAQNPLQFIKSLLGDGVLQLVCRQSGTLSEGVVTSRKEEGSEPEEISTWSAQRTGTKMLRGFLKQTDSIGSQTTEISGKRLQLLMYAMHQFDYYGTGRGRSQKYGLEYLIVGQEREKDNLAAVTERLLLLRTMVNYVYVVSNPVFQEESMTTATTLAAFLAAEALIPMIQQCILLILSLEEACIDVMALLDGRAVPFQKTETSFKMTYAQICACSKELFGQKASAYPMAEKNALSFQQGISYYQYLWMMLMTVSWEKMYNRTLDLIQDDLQIKYNAGFEIETCIAGASADVSYGIPMLCRYFWTKPSKWLTLDADGLIWRKIEVHYAY